jgi:hypothetical protein
MRGTGLPVSAWRKGLDEACRRGWLDLDAGWVRPTPQGFDFLSDIQALFLPD